MLTVQPKQFTLNAKTLFRVAYLLSYQLPVTATVVGYLYILTVYLGDLVTPFLTRFHRQSSSSYAVVLSIGYKIIVHYFLSFFLLGLSFSIALVGHATKAIVAAVIVYAVSVTAPASGTVYVGFCESHVLGITLSHHLNPFLSHHVAYVVLLPFLILRKGF
jgi:hypothetical protein